MSYYSIPDRWLNYKSVGCQIDETPFVAFKVPLDEKFMRDLPAEKQFGPNELKELLPRVSLIIDLTFTTKYYNKDVFESLGIDYVKIACPGHEIPSVTLIERFFDIVDEFLSRCKRNKGNLIGVHCTHGINRTGFFICSYMINKLGYDCRTAISEFNKARGHEMERENYINQLELYEQYPIQHFNAMRRRSERRFVHPRQAWNGTKFREYTNFKPRIYKNQVPFFDKGDRRNRRRDLSSHNNPYSFQFNNSRQYDFDASRNRTSRRTFFHDYPRHRTNYPNSNPPCLYSDSGPPSSRSFPRNYQFR